MARKKRNDSFRDKCSSMVSPHFEILYKVMDTLSTRYGVVLPIEFWIAITLTIYALYMHFYGYSDTELLFFGSFAILSFLYANTSLFSNYIKKIRESTPETTLFLNEIENKETKDVEKFLRDYRELSSKEIFHLLRSKFSSIPSIHLSILKYQRISGEILEYIIANDLDRNINSEILSKYIYFVRDDISNLTINQICMKYKDPEIIKSLFVNFPSHLKKIRIFTFLSRLRITVHNWFRYGSGDAVVAMPAFIIAIISTVIYYGPLLVSAAAKYDIIGIIFNLLNVGMGFFIIFGFVFIVIKLTILGLLRIFKWSLYILAPSSI